LENTQIKGKEKKPKSVGQAQSNIQRALMVFQERKPYGLPHYYVDNIESLRGVLKGQQEVIWGMLSAIREIYPQSEPRNQSYLHLTNTGLPYSLDHLRRLELSIIVWLKSLGLVGSGERIVTILEIEREIRNGTLLCELAQIIAKKKLNGVFKSPKTDATALANLQKALECFRSISRINRK